MCVLGEHVHAYFHVNAGIGRGRKRVPDSLDLKLQVVVNHVFSKVLYYILWAT